MKNLRINSIHSIEDQTLIALLKKATKFCLDVFNEFTFFATSSSVLVVDKNGSLSKEIFIEQAFPSLFKEYKEGSLVMFDFLLDDLQLCLVFQSGVIATIRVEDEKVELVGSLPGPIHAATWSPDQQLLILASDDMLFALSREFDIISEESLRPNQAGKDQLMTVGWGSRETQFQGAAGRQNREQVDENKVPVAVTSVTKNKLPLISWRADAQFFTVSTLDEFYASSNSEHEKVSCRQLRVWSRELELMSKCEFLAGQEGVLCMRPSGNLIATTRVLHKKRSVWFFERNGQYRRNFEFLSREGEGEAIEVKSLSWNMDSSILAICCSCNQTADQVQFWTVSNYCWMQKLCYEYSSPLKSACWNPENGRRFHLLTNDGHYHKLELNFEYNCEQMLVVVVNGDKLKFTNLSAAPVPPPLCHWELQLQKTPSAIALDADLSFLAVLSYNELSVYEFNQQKCQLLKHLKLTTLQEMSQHSFLYNLQWKNASQLSAITRSSDGRYALVEIDLESGQISCIHSCNQPIVYQKYSSSSANYHLVSDEGVHCRISAADKAFVQGEQGKPLSRLHNCRYVNGLNLMICLTDNHKLIVDGQVLHQSVSSYSLVDGNTRGFLLITTLDSFLHAISLQELQQWTARGNALDKKEQFFKAGRSIERGAQLVGHDPLGTAVWLQMPRGNLETIHPRALLVRRLQLWLDNLNFGQALKEMRRHRINTNLIYDHNPQAFLSHIARFLEQVTDVDQLNLFISSLQQEDSTQTMFQHHYPQSPAIPQPTNSKQPTSKVNEICQALIAELLKQGNQLTHLYPAVLTCFVVQKPSLVAQALSHMQQQLQKENGQADHLLALWLRHLSYLVDERTLFNQALKTYDLHIALKVAEASDRDPKEYLPLLNSLRQYSPFAYQCFQIDLLLEDWSSGLKHLAQVLEEDSSRLEECIRHIQTHYLHSQALALFSDHKHQQEILEVCALKAFNTKCWAEACQLYIQANQPAQALECLCLQLDYEEYIQLATAHPSLVTPQQLQTNLKKMCVQLEARANYMAVAEILLYIDKQANKAKILECYCLALEWKAALRFAQQTSQITSLKAILEQRCVAVSDQLRQWHSLLLTYTHRLGLVRQAKQTQLLEWVQQEAEDLQDVGQSEVLSQTSTVSTSSRFSKMSTSSSRKKKHIERKKKQIKEGSQYEDAALLTALKDLFHKVDGQQDEMPQLLPVLLALHLIVQGQQVQKEVVALLQTCWDIQASIWPAFLEPKHLPGPLFEIYRCADGIVRMPVEGIMPERIQIEDEMVAPQIRRISDKWRLNMFEVK